ncbi:CCHC-type domain-containing protein [Trichonephila clavipes]|nr:CCHC-type domain-containing protein [Trichonephila clavipes]
MLTSFLQHDHRYRSQCVYHSERSGSKVKRETYLDPAPRGATDRDGEKIDIHGKLKVNIKFGDTTYQHAVYVADIADPFILGLDFLKEHGFTLDFNKNELRSIHEEVTIFKIEHGTESIRQLTPDLLENADALSRRPCPENCRHCSRVETKYDYAIRQITTSTATPPDPWSDEKVREDQMADPDIKPLIEFMESSSNKPSWQDISAYSPTTKQYWALWNFYISGMVFYTENSNQRMERHSGGN